MAFLSRRLYLTNQNAVWSSVTQLKSLAKVAASVTVAQPMTGPKLVDGAPHKEKAGWLLPFVRHTSDNGSRTPS